MSQKDYNDCVCCAYENVQHCNYFNAPIHLREDEGHAKRFQTSCRGFILLERMREHWEKTFQKTYTGVTSKTEK